jgi:phage terminase Nu1 subunit (DNA packaging protein)
MKANLNIFEYKQGALPEMEYKTNQKSISFVADIFEVSEQTIRDWASMGIIEKPLNGQLDLLEVIRKVYKYQRTLIVGTGTQKLTDERADFLKIKKQISELELKKLQGASMDMEKVKRVAYSRAKIESQMLNNLPSRLKSILAAETDEFKIEQLLRMEIENITGAIIKASKV